MIAGYIQSNRLLVRIMMTMKLDSRTLFSAIYQTLIFAVENMLFSWKLL